MFLFMVGCAESFQDFRGLTFVRDSKERQTTAFM